MKLKNIQNIIKYFVVILIVLVFINIAFLINTNVKSKSLSVEKKVNSNYLDQNFYDSQCPSIDMFSLQNNEISLSDLKGDVIVMHFTRFQLQEIPRLIYLEHLYKAFQSHDVHLYFIHHSDRRYSNSSYDWSLFNVPIIEDDGFISSIFNARPNDTILIGRDFKIKFKHYAVENRIIYNQFIRFLFEDYSLPKLLETSELSSIIKRINYKNVKSGKIENLEEQIEKDPAVISISFSICFTCPETQRIKLLKKIAEETKNEKIKIFILFGKGNDDNLIKQFSEKNTLFEFIKIGIIEDSSGIREGDYYNIFKFDVDPRTFIFNGDGNLVFVENLKNRDDIDFDYLIKEIN